jgi:hypothetical protein
MGNTITVNPAHMCEYCSCVHCRRYKTQQSLFHSGLDLCVGKAGTTLVDSGGVTGVIGGGVHGLACRVGKRMN